MSHTKCAEHPWAIFRCGCLEEVWERRPRDHCCGPGNLIIAVAGASPNKCVSKHTELQSFFGLHQIQWVSLSPENIIFCNMLYGFSPSIASIPKVGNIFVGVRIEADNRLSCSGLRMFGCFRLNGQLWNLESSKFHSWGSWPHWGACTQPLGYLNWDPKL